MSQKGVVRQFAINTASILLLLGIISRSGLDKQVDALELPTDTPTITATPTSQPGVPLLISPADGELLAQPVWPYFWKFVWYARTGPCVQLLDIWGPENRHLHFETTSLFYQYQANQYIPETALEPWYWQVTVQCPLGSAVSERREFHVMKIPRTPPPPSFTPTFTKTGVPSRTVGPSITPTYTKTGIPSRTVGPSITPTYTKTGIPSRTVGPSITPTYTKTVGPSITPTFTLTPTSTPNDGCLIPPSAPTPVYPMNQSIVSAVKITFDWTSSTCAKSYWLLIWIGSSNYNLPRLINLPHLLNSETTVVVPLRNHGYIWHVAACNEHGCAWSRWNRFLVGETGK